MSRVSHCHDGFSSTTFLAKEKASVKEAAPEFNYGSAAGRARRGKVESRGLTRGILRKNKHHITRTGLTKCRRAQERDKEELGAPSPEPFIILFLAMHSHTLFTNIKKDAAMRGLSFMISIVDSYYNKNTFSARNSQYFECMERINWINKFFDFRQEMRFFCQCSLSFIM